MAKRIWTLLLIIAGGIFFWLIFPDAYLNYDTFYAMLWAKDIVHGHLPNYQFAVAPTPHPLATLVSIATVGFGKYADDALLMISFFSFSALIWTVYEFTKLSFTATVGLLAAAIVATRQPLISFAIRAYVDIPFLALIMYAAVLELRRPKRGWDVLVLLSLAGLLRPEAWLFAAIYYLYITLNAPLSRRVSFALLVAAAPALWLISDLIVTGDPIHSFHGTNELAAQLKRPNSLADLPTALPVSLGYIVREPVLIGAVFGLIFGWIYARPKFNLALSMAAINIATFVLFSLAGLPLLARYLLVAALMLIVMCAAAALGWLSLPKGKARQRWQIVGAVVLLLLAIFVPAQYRRLSNLRHTTTVRGEIQEDIRRLITQTDAVPYLKKCRPIYAPNHRPVPTLRYWLGAGKNKVVSAYNENRQPATGVMLAPNTPLVRKIFVLDPRDRKLLNVPVPGNFKRVANNRSWALYASPSCLQNRP